MPHYISKSQAAKHVQTSERTIRNWIGSGKIRGFRIGPRQIVVDLDEIELMLRVTPPTKARDGRKLYGKNSTIVPLPGIVLPGVQR
jgi:excisionase family DNA binding protein